MTQRAPIDDEDTQPIDPVDVPDAGEKRCDPQFKKSTSTLIGLALAVAVVTIAAVTALLGFNASVGRLDDRTHQLEREREQLRRDSENADRRLDAVINEYRRDMCDAWRRLPQDPVIAEKRRRYQCDVPPSPRPSSPLGIRAT